MIFPRFKILNSKDIKNIKKVLEQQYGFSGKLDGVFLFNESKRKLYLISEDIKKIMELKIKSDNVGLNIGSLDNNRFRFTIEGSQLYGKSCKKNIIELNEEEAKRWMRGEDIDIKDNMDYEWYVIIKHKNDFLGSGKISTNKILNYVSKARRVP